MRFRWWPPRWLVAIQETLVSINRAIANVAAAQGVVDHQMEIVLSTLHDHTAALARIEEQEKKAMSLADDILVEATNATTVGQAAIALIQTLVTQSGGDPVKLQQALDALKANDAAVNAAVLANTPQAPAPTP